MINHEIDPSSIEVNRRARRAKTDRIDLEKLMRTFLAYLRGEPRVCSMVHVPSVEEEDRKRRTRERERLVKERTAHINRIKGLLHGQGVRDAMPFKPGFIAGLEQVAYRRRPPAADAAQGGDRARARAPVSGAKADCSAGGAEQSRAALGRTRLVGGQDYATPRSQGHRSDQRAGAGQRGVLSLVRQSPPARQLFRAHRHALRQRRKPTRAGHQQSRQPARPHGLRSSSPGCGCGINPTASSAAGSASGSATSRDACDGSPS